MRTYLLLCLIFISYQLAAQSNVASSSLAASKITSPLSAYSQEWNEPRYLACNTAKNVKYMNAKEKELIYILNLVRVNPKLFAETVLKNYPDKNDEEWLVENDNYKSLLDTLFLLPPLNILKPNIKCFESAHCHALSCSKDGLIGHDRKTKECEKKMYYQGECIDYGGQHPLEILMNLMIDEGVPSLGHRLICISGYSGIGVSIQPHKQYRYSTVLDFTYESE